MSDRHLPRKLTFSAHGRTLVLRKRPEEKPEHRLMMALTWALYLPRYPELRVDVPVGARYRPDLVQLGDDGRPVFWGECGEVGAEKLRALCGRYRDTHLVFARWGPRWQPFADAIAAAARGVRRSAPIELLGFDEGAERLVGTNGEIAIGFADVHRQVWAA